MTIVQKLRKWHFLALGVVLILVAGFLWYWDWHYLGIPKPLRPEHFITIFVFLLGVFVLGVFIYRLNRRQVTVMLVGMILVNLLAALATLWVFRTYPLIFELVRVQSIEVYDPVYVSQWQACFLEPALYALHVSLLLLWFYALLMFFIRKPTDQPE